MAGRPVGAHWQNQRTPSDDDTAVLSYNANWATNHPARASCTSDAYKRLRLVTCPSEMIDQIGGWSSGRIGESYGEGFSASRIMNFMQKIAY